MRKALESEPSDRYPSVEAFADDIRAFLELRPVRARAANAWYLTTRFLRRYWLPASAAAVTVASLSLGLYTANRERALAQRRFQQVRQLANRVLGLDEMVGALPGSTKARRELVEMSREYLEALAPDARNDKELALEIGFAYVVLARAQGVPGAQNLAQYAQAEESLKKAEQLIGPALDSSPKRRQALFSLADISHGLMTLASQNRHRDEEVLTHAQKAVARLDAFLATGPPSPQEIRPVSAMFFNIALSNKNAHRNDDAIKYARRAAEVARMLPHTEDRLVSALSLLADLTRISGDLEGALQVIREAKAALGSADLLFERQRQNTAYQVFYREGLILGGDNGPSLNRPVEAVAAFQKAFDVIEDASQADPADTFFRILFDQTGQELGGILRDSDPQRALRVYDHSLRRLREVPDENRRAGREAAMLVGSSYALRRLSRTGEAKAKIDDAFGLLRKINEYPSDKIDSDSEAEPALRALGDYYAEIGQPARAGEVYQELLEKILASKPAPETDLRHATKLSRIYGSLADLRRRNREMEAAESLSQMRRNLWLAWDRKLPNNTYVRRQLQAANSNQSF